MPLTKIEFKPGINKENTSYSNEGGFYNCDKIRFRSGYAEKIGGWQNFSFGQTFSGITFSLWNWSSLSAEDLIGFGTNQRYYVSYLNNYYPITPIRTTLSTIDYTTVAGSSKVTISITGNGATAGAWVALTGPVSVGGISVAAGSYEIVDSDASSYIRISVPTPAVSSATVASVQTATFEINASSPTYTYSSLGWGIGPWGGGGWGHPTVPNQFNLWSQGNFGQDLIMALYGGPIYYWTKDTTTFARAVTLNSYASGVVKTSKTATFGAGVISITVGDSLGINAGATISGFGIVPGTTVTLAYIPGSTTVPISIATGAASGAGSYTFSYAGPFTPVETNQVLVSTVYQFVVAIGSNPYDPTNTSTAFNPMLVRWSDQSNPAEWVPETSNQAGEQSLGHGSYLVAAVPTRQEILIWSDTALYTMQYVGAPFIFNFQLLMDNISIISPNAAITVNNVTYWMGTDKFYMYSGQVQTLPCTLRSYVFKNLNESQNIQVVAGTNPAFNEVWWFYPSIGSDINDSYVIYNYLENIWYYGTLNRTAWLATPARQTPIAAFSLQNTFLSAAITATDTSITAVNAITYPATGVITIGTEQISYSSIVGNTFTGCVRGINSTTAVIHAEYAPVTYYVPNQLMLHEYGIDDASVSASSPSPIAAYIETADFDIEDGQNFAFVYRMVPDLTFQGSTAGTPTVMLTVKPRINSGSAYTSPVPTPTVENTVKAPTPPMTYPVEQFTGQVYTRVRGRQMAFRIDSADVGVMWQLGSMRFDMRTDGRRA